MKKVITQHDFPELKIGIESKKILISQRDGFGIDCVVIEKTKSREVAVTICPELQKENETMREALNKLKDEEWRNGVTSEFVNEICNQALNQI